MLPFLMRDPRGVKNLFSWEAEFELPVKDACEALMSTGAIKDVPIDVLVAACADLVAISAARLDAEGDTTTIDDRLQAFCYRVERTYRQMKSAIKRNDKVRPVW